MIDSTTRRGFLGIAAVAGLSAGCSSTVTSDVDDEGFRTLFDGKTLKGWHPIPRLPLPGYPGAEAPDKESTEYKRAASSSGRWRIENGAILGEQEPPGSGLGAYLITDEVFGDFELLIDVNPDWPADSGIMLRATEFGGQGFQVHMDYRFMGSVGTFYGNGIGDWRARHYSFNPKFDASGKAVGLIQEPVPDYEEANLSFASAPDIFFKVWRFGDWNTLRIRCEGRYPQITTWLNGEKLAGLDAAKIQAKNYDKDAVAELLGRRGHIALEVHNTGGIVWGGDDRWMPGNVCRWRNIRIKTLD